MIKTIKTYLYYLAVIAIGGYLIYSLYNHKALFTLKADIENKAYQIEQLLNK
jgi:hypothetical protein